MEKQLYFYSALNEKESYYRNNVRNSSNKIFHLSKALYTNPSFESEKILGTDIKFLSNFSKLIHNKVKQYQKHPFRHQAKNNGLNRRHRRHTNRN